jgi:AcrR family transcriptional regulator
MDLNLEDRQDRQDSSGSVSGGRRRARRGRSRDPEVDEAIMTAAMALLAEIGYARLTMDQVAARARVGKASLYLRWPNKVALVAEALQHHSAVAPDVPDTGSLREDMRTFLRALLRSKTAAQRAVAAVTGEIASNPELAKAWRQGVAGTLLACARTIVERAIARGELPVASDVDLLTMLPVTLLQNWRQTYDYSPDDAVIERIVAQFFTPTPGRAQAEEAGRSHSRRSGET